MLKFPEKYVKPKENAYELFFEKTVPLLDQVECPSTRSSRNKSRRF